MQRTAVSGSLSKTAVNASAAGVPGLGLLGWADRRSAVFLTSLFEDLPEVMLAAVVIAAVIQLVDVPALVEL